MHQFLNKPMISWNKINEQGLDLGFTILHIN